MDTTKLGSEIGLTTTSVISGLTYIPNYINVTQQSHLVHLINQQVWSIESVESKRRIQQHGYRYEYKNGFLVAASYLGLLPNWGQSLAQQFYDRQLIATVPDQLTVNEYEPGQGLTSHIDCVSCFGNTITTLSLVSSSVMEFTHSQTQETVKILLLPGSLLILQKEARYSWKHGVAACTIDTYMGKEFLRTRRVSLTFRKALFPHR